MPRVHFLSNRKFPSKIFDPPLKNSSPSLLGKEFKLELIFSMHLARMKKRNWIVSYYFPPRYIYETYEKFELFSFLFFNPGTSGSCNIYFCDYVLWYNNVGNIKFGSTFNKILQKKYSLGIFSFYTNFITILVDCEKKESTDIRLSTRKSNTLDILDILDIQNYIKLVEKNKCIVLNTIMQHMCSLWHSFISQKMQLNILT